MPADDTKVKPSKLHQAARAFAAAGVKVFPCVPSEKRPISRHGFYEATTDLKQIDKWWTENPDANIATSPHLQGQAVVDLDGKIGIENWEFLGLMHDTPETYVVRTPRGGQHWYYRGELHASASKIEKKIDTRGVGSYVLLPPSVTADGEYTVLHDRPIAELPAWISAAARKHREHKKAAAGTRLDTSRNIEAARRFLKGRVVRNVVAIEGEGGHDHTYQTACEVLDHGLSPEKAHELLLAEWNEHCQPPWDEGELQTIIGNAARYQQNEPGSKVQPSASEVFKGAVARMGQSMTPLEKIFAKAGLNARGGNSVKDKEYTWLWRDRLPDVTSILAGYGDVGKTTLLLEIAASVTRGRPWPDGQANQQPRHVIYLSAEDSVEQTLKPRFKAAGGDLERIIFLEGRKDENGDHTEISLAEDFKQIGEAIVAARMEGIDIALLIIDPLSSYIGTVDSWNNEKVRSALGALFKRLPEQAGIAVICNAHFNKTKGTSANMRITGSTAFKDMARTVHVVVTDPEDPEARIFIPTKRNIIPPTTRGLHFQLNAKQVMMDDGTPSRQKYPFINWTGKPVNYTSGDELLQVSDKGGERTKPKEHVIAEVVAGVLADGAWHRVQKVEAALAQHNIIVNMNPGPGQPSADKVMMHRVRKRLGAETEERGREWMWRIPED